MTALMFEIVARIVLLLLSLLLLAAALIKLRDLPIYLSQAEAWRILPRRPARLSAAALVGIELTLGLAGVVAALLGRGAWPASLAVAVLFTGFAVAQAIIFRRTGSAPCGCGVWHGDVSSVSIARSGTFALLAGIATFAL